VARTLNPASHAVKRDAFVDAAQRLIQAKGYEAFSIQDILDEVGASKGAFYHYFGSKGDLLEALVERIADGILTALTPIASDPSMTALQKLQAVFSEGGRLKSESKELMVALLRPWYADANVLVRERVNRAVIGRLTPILAPILAGGREDGSISVSHPRETAGIVLAMFVASGDTTSRLFLDRLEGRISFEQVARTVRAFDEAIERTLGLPAGSFRLMSDDLMRFWFG
jgi:AcrR family transcriptional regulator